MKIAKEISFDEFVEKIKNTKTYCSNSYKEYRVMKANKDILVLRDQRTRNEFQVSTMQLYVAMQEREIQNCTVANMKFYLCCFWQRTNARSNKTDRRRSIRKNQTKKITLKIKPCLLQYGFIFLSHFLLPILQDSRHIVGCPIHEIIHEGY